MGSSLISVPGSSKWVSQGFVTYSNIAKINFLGVNKQTLKDYGAVDTKVTDEMVRGVLKYDLADIAIAISGVAGPTGGSKSKPVGTVCISIGNNDEILSKFLPKQLGEEETKKICAELIAKLGASSVKDMGKVMGELKKLYSDEIDFSKAGSLIKELLNN